MQLLTRCFLSLALCPASGAALAQTAPLHSLGEAGLVARAQGYTAVGNLERRGDSIWATAIDRQGNHVRLELDRRTGAIVGINVVEASSPLHPPLPTPVAPAPPIPAPGVEPRSYYIPPEQPLGAPRIGLPGLPWCGRSPRGPGC